MNKYLNFFIKLRNIMNLMHCVWKTQTAVVCCFMVLVFSVTKHRSNEVVMQLFDAALVKAKTWVKGFWPLKSIFSLPSYPKNLEYQIVEFSYKRHNGAKMKKVFRKIISKVKIIFNLLKACGWPALLANFLKNITSPKPKNDSFPGG